MRAEQWQAARLVSFEYQGTPEGKALLSLFDNTYPKFQGDDLGDDSNAVYLRMTEAQKKDWNDLCAHFEGDISKLFEEKAQARKENKRYARICANSDQRPQWLRSGPATLDKYMGLLGRARQAELCQNPNDDEERVSIESYPRSSR